MFYRGTTGVFHSLKAGQLNERIAIRNYAIEKREVSQKCKTTGTGIKMTEG